MPIFGVIHQEVNMDGFRERLGGRYDRSQMRGSGYDRTTPEDRYEGDRYERSSRRGGPEGISQEMINEAVAEAVNKSNREQLDVIADFFDEAKADRMESERAIIDALSHCMSEKQEAAAPAAVAPAPAAAEPAAPAPAVDEKSAETLARIERIAGQNAEALNESNEMLERNVDSLRSNAEVLSEIKNTVGALVSSTEELKSASSRLQEDIKQSIEEASTKEAPSMQELTVDFTSEKNEIIGAVGDNRAILNMIRQDVLNGFAKTLEEEDEDKPAPLTAEDADRYYKELEDHVQKECVKCYRNVQSALTEQAAEANTGLEKNISGTKTLTLVSLILNGFTLLLVVLYYINSFLGLGLF